MLRQICKVAIATTALAAAFAGWLSGCAVRDDANTIGDAKVMTAGAAPAADAAAGERKVTIDNFSFAPNSLTVPAGTKVQWLNRDDVPHTVTSSDSPAKFKSQALDTDESYSHVFVEPGTYAYFCAVHPKMTGTIVVVAPK